MNAIDILRDARALIQKGWCQNFCAVTAADEPISLRDDRAAKFCSLAAIERAGCSEDKEMSEAEGLLRRVVDPLTIVRWNDDPDRTQAEILTGFDRAIVIALAGREAI